MAVDRATDEARLVSCTAVQRDDRTVGGWRIGMAQ